MMYSHCSSVLLTFLLLRDLCWLTFLWWNFVICHQSSFWYTIIHFCRLWPNWTVGIENSNFQEWHWCGSCQWSLYWCQVHGMCYYTKANCNSTYEHLVMSICWFMRSDIIGRFSFGCFVGSTVLLVFNMHAWCEWFLRLVLPLTSLILLVILFWDPILMRLLHSMISTLDVNDFLD